MRICGIEENDQLFKDFQKKFVDGVETEEFWTWLRSEVTFVEAKSKEFVKNCMKKGDLNDYTFLFPTNKLVDE